MAASSVQPKEETVETILQADPPPTTVHRRRMDVSIVIAGRNSEKWILDAVRSACFQTVACEVIYSDDASTDRSVELVRYGVNLPQVIVIESPVHSGVVATRNRGAAVARGKYLVFLDSDDVMPDDYIEKHLAAMVPGAPFVYGAAEAFGDGPYAGMLWKPAEWHLWDRWAYNTVNTSSLYARWAFDAAGGWQDVPTMWDFDLALRASRFGTEPPRTSSAVLKYRQHSGSWSQQVDVASEDVRRGEYAEIIHRRNARLSIATIYSGRMTNLLPRWLDAVAATVRQAELRNKPILQVAIDPAAGAPAVGLAAKYADTMSVRWEVLPFAKEPHTDEKTRRDAVSRFLAKANQWICDTLRPIADAVWIIEDDVLVPLTACQDLWRSLTAGMICPAAVSGLYRNRHLPKQFVGGSGPPEFIELTSIPAATETALGIAGCGCLMTWLDRPMIPKEWPSHLNGIPAHDWAFCQTVRDRGGQILMNSRVRCGHARTSEDILYP